MRQISIIILLISIFVADLSAQRKTIKGRIISEDLETLPGVKIQDADTVLLGTTGIDGRFTITIPQETKKLIFSWVGMEWTSIELFPGCDNLEVIMMIEVIYDFASLKKVNRLRKRRFKKLHKVRVLAIDKGLFEEKDACYLQEFIPYKMQ